MGLYISVMDNGGEQTEIPESSRPVLRYTYLVLCQCTSAPAYSEYNLSSESHSCGNHLSRSKDHVLKSQLWLWVSTGSTSTSADYNNLMSNNNRKNMFCALAVLCLFINSLHLFEISLTTVELRCPNKNSSERENATLPKWVNFINVFVKLVVFILIFSLAQQKRLLYWIFYPRLRLDLENERNHSLVEIYLVNWGLIFMVDLV